MKVTQLTSRSGPAHKAPMRLARSGLSEAMPRVVPHVVAMLGLFALPGCISVNAPDKPIVIELNINITQEVIYRLAGDVRENIEENAEIF